MKLSDLIRKVIITLISIALIFILGSVIYYRSLDCLPFVFGIILGTAISIIKIFLLTHTVDRALNEDKSNAKKIVSLHQFVRFVIVGIVLVIASVVPQINLWGVVIGVLAFQPAIYIARSKGTKVSSNHNKSEELEESEDYEELEEAKELEDSEELEEPKGLEKSE